jgi:hypothetical protein
MIQEIEQAPYPALEKEVIATFWKGAIGCVKSRLWFHLGSGEWRQPHILDTTP